MADQITGIQATVSIDGEAYDVISAQIEEGLDAVPRARLRVAREAALERPAALLGKEVSLHIGPIEAFDEARRFHGRVVSAERRLFGITRPSLFLEVCPDLFRATKRSDLRTFQNLSLEDVVKEVCDRAGVGDVRFVLNDSREPREYLVQYRETDFDFLRRVLSEEGVAFTYDHEQEEWIFFDDPKGVGDAAVANVIYYPEFGFGQKAATVSKLSLVHEVKSDKTHLRQYDFTRPRFKLESIAEGTDDGEKALEIYQYPARSTKDAVIEHSAQVLVESLQARRLLLRGDTTAQNLYPGRTFTVEQHPFAEFNTTLLATKVTVEFSDDRGPTGGRGGSLKTSFEAMDPNVSHYRPVRLPRAALLHGPQTALTTGPAGEEIHVDEHGRVNAQFPWDRVGTRDDKSSLPIRTCQLPTGGSMLLPRVGWEVLVQHDEGDQDLPLVMSRLYNQLTMPPYALPQAAARTAVQTATTPGGGSSNEMRFDDTKGNEEMFFNASKDMTVAVKHNATESVGANATRTIGSNLLEEITNSLTTSIGGSDTESVGGNEKLATETLSVAEIGGDHTLVVGGNRDLKVGGDHKHTVAGASSLDVGSMKADLVVGKVSETTDANASLDVGAARVAITASTHSTEVAGNHDETIGALKVILGLGGISSAVEGSSTTMMAGAKVNLVDGDRSEEAGGAMTWVAAGATIVKADNITYEAESLLTFVMGASTIVLTPASVSILGVSIKIDGATVATAALITDN